MLPAPGFGSNVRTAELDIDNHQQRQPMAHLEADGHELVDILAAAHAMDWALMGGLNRRSGADHGGGASRPPRRQQCRLRTRHWLCSSSSM